MTVESIGAFGKYELLEQLGAGETSELFLTRSHHEPPRALVLKRLRPHLAADKAYAAAFVDGAKRTSSLEHVCPVREVGAVEGQPFLVRDYLSGRDLRSLVRRQSVQRRLVPQPVALFIVGRICTAIEKGKLLHGCLTPQDVLLGFMGQVQLINFGMGAYWASLAAAKSPVPKDKSAYFSPEHLARSLDSRTDVFAAGLILYELLTGRQVFPEGLDVAGLAMARTQGIAPPASVRPALSAGLDAVVMRALEWDPDKRYGTAGELCKALEGLDAAEAGMGGEEDLASLLGRTFANELRTEKEREALVASGGAVKEKAKGSVEKRAGNVDAASQQTAPTESARAVVSPVAGEGASRSFVLRLGLGAGAIVLLAVGGYFLFVKGPADSAREVGLPGKTEEVIRKEPPATALEKGASEKNLAVTPSEKGVSSGEPAAALKEAVRNSGERNEEKSEAKTAVRKNAGKENRSVKAKTKPHYVAHAGNVHREARAEELRPNEGREANRLASNSDGTKAADSFSSTKNSTTTLEKKDDLAGKQSGLPKSEGRWGFFLIVSPVPVEVMVDGWRSAVIAGQLNLKLSVGTHQVTVIFKDSGRKFNQQVTIKPDKTIKLKLVKG